MQLTTEAHSYDIPITATPSEGAHMPKKRKYRTTPGLSTTDLYPDIVEFCTGEFRSTPEVFEAVQPLRPGFAQGGLKQALVRWTDGGALQQMKAVRDGKSVALFQATRVALEPGTVQRVLGSRRAVPVLDRLGLAPEPPQGQLPGLASVHAMTVEPARQHVINRQQLDIPDDLFTASFGPRGVTITYEQFHRIVALLDALAS